MWPRLISIALGIWLMFAPFVLGYEDLAADHDRIIGPLAASCACIAIWEATRGLRWVNAALGAWLAIAPWLLGFAWVPTSNSVAVGVALFGMACVRGTVKHQLDGGWRVLWNSNRGPT